MKTHLNLIASAAGIIVFFLLISLAQEVNRQWQVQREVQQLQTQVRDQQAAVVELEQLNQYFRTDDFRERLSREKLNYRAPGEQVVLIPDGEWEAATPEADLAPARSSIPRRWWNVFFAMNATAYE